MPSQPSRALALSLALLAASPSWAATLTIRGSDAPGVSNCIPFGGWSDASTGYMGFVYKNIPAFNLRSGDSIRFDLGGVNDVDIIMDIDVATTAVNGGDTRGGAWTRVVTLGTASSRGNTTIGDFETSFTVTAPFSFSGGGLMMRFTPRGGFASDKNCTQTLVHSSNGDPSGYFVKRFFRDSDGDAPWTGTDNGSIAHFRLIYTDRWYADTDGDGQGDPDVSYEGSSPPSGYVSNDTDCDDSDPNIKVGATEICDLEDNDCDGDVDEGVQSTFYADTDGDTFGDLAATQAACQAPTGYVANSTDCDDTDPEERPGQVWHKDLDNDSFGDAASPLVQCLRPTGHVVDDTDCNDGNAAIKPGAAEVCNGVDDDCASGIDDGLPFVWYYRDQDLDAFPKAADALETCDGAPAGYIGRRSDSRWDCDDTAPGVNPLAAEICNSIDDNCNGLVDNEDPDVDASTQGLWYEDRDGDTYGNSAVSRRSCVNVPGFVSGNDRDCDDGNAAINPGAAEVCNGVDDNCDGPADDADLALDLTTATTWYADTDGDSFGDANAQRRTCAAPTAHVANDDDCDDTDADEFPGAEERCDGDDDDCDGDIDEPDAVDAPTWYADADLDGFGDAEAARRACERPEGFLADDTDCDDADPDANPAAEERCDDDDDDCDGDIDEPDAVDAARWYADSDRDTYGWAETMQLACAAPEGYVADDTDCNDADPAIHPGATEIEYDGVDQDCTGADFCDVDLDGAIAEICGGTDCDDTDPEILAGVAEIWYDGVDQDCDGGDDYDADGDGHRSAAHGGDDCDDSDPNVYPGAPDEPYDGVVTDCDDADEYDVDGDGHDGLAAGGDDCDDANSEISPSAVDVPGDGIDQDCDGADAIDLDTGDPEEARERCGCSSGGGTGGIGAILALLGASLLRRRR